MREFTNRGLFAAVLLMTVSAAAAADEVIKIDHWGVGPVYVHQRDAALAPAQFNASLAQYGKRGSVTSCRLFIEVPLARVETVYAGRCTLQMVQRTEDVQICFDTGVGEFGMDRAVDGVDPKSTLVQFVLDHCPGG